MLKNNASLVAIAVVAVVLLLALWWLTTPRAHRSLLVSAVEFLGIVLAGLFAKWIVPKSMTEAIAWLAWLACALPILLATVLVVSQNRRKQDMPPKR